MKYITLIRTIVLLFFCLNSVIGQSNYILAPHVNLGSNTIVGSSLGSNFIWGRSLEGGVCYTSLMNNISSYTNLSFVSDRVSNTFNGLLITRNYVNINIGLRGKIIPNLLHGVLAPYGRILVGKNITSVNTTISSDLEAFISGVDYGIRAKILLNVSKYTSFLLDRRHCFLQIGYEHGLSKVYSRFFGLISAENSENFNKSVRVGLLIGF